ncbi:hypothetical protein BHE74_00050579, partial [Ensete ventricosum]
CSSNDGVSLKKARVQASSAHSLLKVLICKVLILVYLYWLQVRKEKLGDRVAALHQLVAPFGKVVVPYYILLRSICIITTWLSSDIPPFCRLTLRLYSLKPLATSDSSTVKSRSFVCVCFELPVPAIWIKEHDTVLPSLKCRLPHDHLHQQDADGEPKNLRSRGLCLVPVSFILHVGNHNGADFWADSFGMGLR